MTYRKTWFSYVLWVVYTMLCAIFLFFAGNYVCVSFLTNRLESHGMPASLVNSTMRISGLLAVLFAVALYWIIRVISGQIRKKHAGWKVNLRILEGIVVWVALALGIFFRIEQAGNNIQLQNTVESNMQTYINGMEYFDMAVVTPGSSVEPMAYGSAYLYVVCLSFLLSFLGNKTAAAIGFQVVLQIAGLVLAYGVTRRMAGRLPACVVLLYLACSPAYLEMLKNLGPEALFFDLYMIGMLTMVGFVKRYCARLPRKMAVLSGAAGAGILVGILGYLDMAAVTILIVAAVVAVGKKYQPDEEEPTGYSGIINAAVIVMVIAACVVGFMLAVAAFSVCKGTDFWSEIETWAILHVWNTRISGFKPLYPYSLDMLFFGALAVLASFLVFEFFRSGREQNYMLWVLLCIVAAPTPLAVLGVQPFGVISMYIWGVLAGVGLQNCIFGGRARLMKSMIEEINQAIEEIERSTEPEMVEATEPDTVSEITEMNEMSGEKAASVESQNPVEEAQEIVTQESVEEQATAQSQKPVEIQEPTEVQEKPDGQVTEEGDACESCEKPPKKRYLDNPLPVPKKHVRRQMDFQYTVEEKDMKYDVEISEDDDFDI